MFQADLLEVLDSFGVKTPDDFYKLAPGKRPLFLRRLYKAFIQNQEGAFRDLLSSGGVKFHFATSGDLTSNSPNVPSSAFLKRLCFYSNRTLITFPFKKLSNAQSSRAFKGIPAKEWNRGTLNQNRPLLFGDLRTGRDPGYGGWVGLGSEGGYSLDPAAFEDFLQIVTQLKPAIDAGMTYLLPTFPDQKKEFRRVAARLTSANFKLPELKRQFAESELSDKNFYRFDGDLLNLYLPHFTDLPIERLMEIRSNQSDMYNDFQRYMENLFFGLSEDESELKLLNLLREIDSGIRELEKKFKSLRNEYARKDIYVGIGVLCTSLALYAGVEFGKEIAQMIASATGGATGIQFLSNLGERKKGAEALSSERFFVPWLIHRESQKQRAAVEQAMNV